MPTQHPQEAYYKSPSPPAVSHAIIKPLPPNQSPPSFPMETPTAGSSNASNPLLLSPRTDFVLDWVLKVFGVGAAVLFGIWAPISYKATTDGNNGNDASQGQILEQISALSNQASSAADMQGCAAVALAEMQERLNDLGSLRAWEFCEGRATQIPACKSFNSTRKVNSVVSHSFSHESTPCATTFTSHSSYPESGGKATVNLFPVIFVALLGGVAFVVLMFVGFGVLLRRRRSRMRVEKDESHINTHSLENPRSI